MNPRLARILRFLRPSLRAAMVGVLIVGLVLGWIVNEARTRHEVVAAIDRAGGSALYDYEYINQKFVSAKPQNLLWLRRQLGPDYFDRIICVDLYRRKGIDSVMPQVGRLTSLEELSLPGRRGGRRGPVRAPVFTYTRSGCGGPFGRRASPGAHHGGRSRSERGG